MPKDNRQWIFPGIAASVLVIAALSGFLPLFAVQLVFPVVIAIAAYTSGLVPTLLLGVAGALSCLICGMGPMIPIAGVWNALACAAALIPLKKNPRIRPWLWAGMVTLVWGAWILMLQVSFGGQLVSGMAQAVQDEIAASSERDTLLLGAYNLGLARVSDSAVTTVTSPFGQTVFMLNDSARTEMLNSFRTSLEEILPMVICESYVYHVALITLLCTLLPDRRRRKHGEKGIFPALEEWYMPRGTGLKIGLFALGFVIPYLTEESMWLNVGTLTASVFTIAYTVQGMCTMLWIQKKMGMRNAFRYIWAIGIGVLAPILSIMIGLFDQTRDGRRLRVKEEM